MDWIEDEVDKARKFNLISSTVKSKTKEFWEKLLLFNEGLPQEIRYERHRNELGIFYFYDWFILIDKTYPWRHYDLAKVLCSVERTSIEYDYEREKYFLKKAYVGTNGINVESYNIDDNSIQLLFRNAITGKQINDGLIYGFF